jgi:hypothetical protein
MPSSSRHVSGDRDAVRRGALRAAAGLVSTAIVAVALAAGSGTAQSSPRRPQSTPDSVRFTVDLFFRAIADERWPVAAAMLDTSAIRRLVAEQLRRPRDLVRQRELTADDFMRMDSTKPRAVAEYEAKRYREQIAKFDPGETLSYEFSGVRSIEELRALTTLEASARFLQARDFRTQFRERSRMSGCGDGHITLPVALQRIIGVALASDTIAYVLHDDGLFSGNRDAVAPIDPMVMQLRLREGHWRVVPSLTLLGRSNMAYSFGCDSTSRR